MSLADSVAIEKKILREKVDDFLREPHRGTVAAVVCCLFSYHELYWKAKTKESER